MRWPTKHEKGAGKEKRSGKGAGKDKKGAASADSGGKTAPVAAPAPEPEKKGPAKGSLDVDLPRECSVGQEEPSRGAVG